MSTLTLEYIIAMILGIQHSHETQEA
jgi:hypothetical protein